MRLFFKNRHRVSIKNFIKLLIFQLKRVFKIRNTPEWYGLKEVFLKLIHVDGKMIHEDKDFYYNELKNLHFKLRKRPSSDISVFGQIFEEEEYQIVIQTYIENFKENPKNILDAGSNIGLTTLYFNNKLNSANIICVEPDDDNFDILKYNLNSNRIEANLYKAGLWSKNTNLKIINDFRDKKEWSVRVKESETGDLKAITIHTLLEEHQWKFIDILKIDIEGAEKEVFNALNSNLSFLKKTKCIAIEIHDEFNCRQEIYDILNKYHFKCCSSGELTIGVNQQLLS